jgi:transposase-like protein
LTPEQTKELVICDKERPHHVFRQRCQIILLKAAGRKTSDICQIVGIKSEHQFNSWIKRYKSSYATVGIGVLLNVKGQGRKPIFDKQKETALTEQVVKTERQQLENARLILEKELNKSFNRSGEPYQDIKEFFKGTARQVLAGDTNA